MKALFLPVAAAGLLASGISIAQTTSQNAAPAATAPSRTATNSTAATTGTASAMADHDKSAAAGNNNQAVATTSANASAPARGANSFTMGEAKSRLENNGFSNVAGLSKDDNGVWRGNAQKDGSTTMVWLDYKGNSGQGK